VTIVGAVGAQNKDDRPLAPWIQWEKAHPDESRADIEKNDQLANAAESIDASWFWIFFSRHSDVVLQMDHREAHLEQKK
jgi:hypothetical protein